jgi:hypothetical protein
MTPIHIPHRFREAVPIVSLLRGMLWAASPQAWGKYLKISLGWQLSFYHKTK